MRRIRERPVVGGVAAATVLALLARFFALGWRTAHQDEARVADLVLEYLRTGTWQYDPIVHGPFLFHVNEIVFGVVGPSDFTARAVVALAGGLLPLAALLFRDRLRDVEVIALALFLAANPVLLYYSRFMRNDVLLAAFALTAFGFFVRAYDRRSETDLYLGTAAFALGFTAKENALVYLGIWVGAAALLADHRLYLSRAGEGDWQARAADAGRRTRDALVEWWPPLALALVEFLVIIVLFYAPRPDLGNALTNPAALPGVIEAGTVGAWESLYGYWLAGDTADHSFLPYFREYVAVLRGGALVVLLFAVVGFLADRYSAGGPRDLVSFAAYWGGASLLLYPLAADISPIPWAATHTVVPLAIPAAVGAGLVYRKFDAGVARDDRVTAGLAALVLLVATYQVVATGVATSYVHPQDQGPLVQYGQPDDRVEDSLDEIRAAAEGNEGTDVLFYGSHFSNWLYRMPYPWYLDSMDVRTDTTERTSLGPNPPPVVIAPSDDSARIEDTIGDVEGQLEGYERVGKYAIVLEVPNNEVYAVVYVRESALQASESAPGLPAAGPATPLRNP